MKIVDVQRLLRQHLNGAEPLEMKRLGALQSVPQPYSALLCQPHGTIHASSARIGNSDPQSAIPMYRAFLEDAVASQAQLAVTPEYSVPWALIHDIALVQSGPRPPHGSLWALGCESITPAELDTLGAAIAGKAGVRLIHEPFDAQQRAQKAFVDPLVFVFWAVDKAGADALCLLVQFKTMSCRDPDHVEIQSLYLGGTVYKFTAHAGDVSLMALICSDAFAFTNTLVDEHSTNLLLLHIQLNQRPGNIDYAAYRTRLFSVASHNNVEVLSLNWAAQSLIEGSPAPWNAIAGSAWYVAPTGLRLDDGDVNQLHRDGVYYSIVSGRWHGLYLNYSQHSLLIRKQPVFSAGPQVVAPRIPPKVAARRAWDPQQRAWTTVVADDGFGGFITQYAALAGTLPQLCGQDPLAVERALELLEGPDGQVSQWHSLKELRALRVAEEESLRRVTVSQETDPTRQGVDLRRRRVRSAQTAATIPTQSVPWPTQLADLAAGFRYRWVVAEPHSNVEPVNGGRPAALIYLGEDPEADKLDSVYAKVSKARKHHAGAVAIQAGSDANEAAALAEDRLCVAYKANHCLRFYRPTGYATITDPQRGITDDIAGDQS